MQAGGAGAIGYWKAGEGLERYVSAYHRFRADVPPGMRMRDVLFPSWAVIRVALNDGPDWSLKMGNRLFDPMPAISFAGPSSYAAYLDTGGGTLVGVGLLPMGWAQLFGGDVSRYANRIVPLEELDPGARSLRAALQADQASPVAAFDAWLRARLQHRPPADPRIEHLFEMLHDPDYTRIDTMAEALDMTPRTLTTMTRVNFGFTPKLLVRRTRFLRALSAVLSNPEDGQAALEATGYWDRSHFLRDSHLFLGCSIREFNKRRGPLNQLAIHAREAAVGSAV